MNNYRVKFKTSESIGNGLGQYVKYDFVMAGVNPDRVADQIHATYEVEDEIRVIDLGPINPDEVATEE